MVETNDREETIEAAKQNGWKRERKQKEPAKVKAKEKQEELL